MKTLFLFPGQGTQYQGMAHDFYDSSAEVRDLFERASEIVKIDLKKLLFEGTEEDLKKTINTQLSVALAARSAARVLKSKGITAQGCGGFSLGEWPALVEAGIITEDKLFSCLKVRGELMDKAVEKLGKPAGMSAIMFLDPEKIVSTISENKLEDVYPANFNSPVQVVISGLESSLAQAEELLKAAGAKKVVRLRVSGPFHSPLIQYAQDGLREYLQDIPFADPQIAFYANVSGKAVTSGTEAKEYAIQQVTGAVRWTDEEASMKADAYERVLEVGPGTVLQGLWKSAGNTPACQSAGTLDFQGLIN
jgi:[acyl-carrier-protein] S-malonyltransferase